MFCLLKDGALERVLDGRMQIPDHLYRESLVFVYLKPQKKDFYYEREITVHSRGAGRTGY